MPLSTSLLNLRRTAIGLCVAAASAALSPGAAAEETKAMRNARVSNLTTAITRQANLEGRVLWMDATANLKKLSTPEGVSEIFQKCKQANINTVVVDVKPLSGHVLYNSSIAPRLKEWRGFAYPEGHDLLLLAMLEGRRRGIRVYAGINVFSDAHKLVKSGPLYERTEWQATVYDVERTVYTPSGASRTLAVGANLGPADNQIVVYTPSYKDTKALGPSDVAVVAQGDRVTAIVDGGLTELGRLTVPPDGYVLIGRGEGAKWLLEQVQVGQLLTFTGKDVLQPILEAPSEAVGGFVNPALPEARAYMLKLVHELANNYALDGIVLDRMRYSSLRTDFSSLSRELFETHLGKKLENFPQDIYAYDPVPGKPIVRGPYYKEWLEWRARTIRSWVDEATQTAQRARPGIAVAAYVGSWYPVYYGVGVNWGADDYHAGLEWMTPGYAATGYARKLNWLTTGCYYRTATREEARQTGISEDETVEAAAQTSLEAVNDATFLYAGLQVLDYQGKPDDFRKALQAAVQNSQGVMIFDLVYIEEYNWWNILSETFSTPKRAPHDVPGLQSAISQTRKALQPLQPLDAGQE